MKMKTTALLRNYLLWWNDKPILICFWTKCGVRSWNEYITGFLNNLWVHGSVTEKNTCLDLNILSQLTKLQCFVTVFNRSRSPQAFTVYGSLYFLDNETGAIHLFDRELDIFLTEYSFPLTEINDVVMLVPRTEGKSLVCFCFFSCCVSTLKPHTKLKRTLFKIQIIQNNLQIHFLVVCLGEATNRQIIQI